MLVLYSSGCFALLMHLCCVVVVEKPMIFALTTLENIFCYIFSEMDLIGFEIFTEIVPVVLTSSTETPYFSVRYLIGPHVPYLVIASP